MSQYTTIFRFGKEKSFVFPGKRSVYTVPGNPLHRLRLYGSEALPVPFPEEKKRPADAGPPILHFLYGLNLYPTPQMVMICAGLAGSFSSVSRSRLIWTGTVAVLPRESMPQIRV